MKRLIVSGALLLASMTASADYLGLTTARTADLNSQPQLTVDAGLNFGDDATVIGALAAYKFSPSTMLTGTIGNLDLDGGGDDIVFGGGVMHQLANSPLPNMDMAVRGLFNMWDAGIVDFTEFGFEVVVSPVEQTVLQGAQVYGYAGMHMLKSSFSGNDFFGDSYSYSNSNTEIVLGGGALMPLGKGEGFALIELLDGISFGVGYRMALGQ